MSSKQAAAADTALCKTPLDTCPHDGRPLVLFAEPDGNEAGVWTHHFFACSEDSLYVHHFTAESNGEGDFVAVDDEGED